MIVFKIKQLRKQKGYSVRKLSKLSNVSKSYIEDLEKGKKFNPTMDKLYSISSALDINVKDLFFTEFDIDTLKQEMYKRIDEFGLNSTEVMEISQILDLLINIDMQEKETKN